MKPGKSCAYETDINIPMVIRGPGIGKNVTKDFPTTHTDMVPTMFSLAGIALRDDFDGVAIPLSSNSGQKLEHVGIEFWGNQHFEGKYSEYRPHNTYKSVRVIGDSYSLAYTVWCTHEHELYDMLTDPDQMTNLVPGNGTSIRIGGQELAVPQVAARLDALIQVLRTCKGAICVKPWSKLHPQGNVGSLIEALEPEYNHFYTQEVKMKFDGCPMSLGYFPGREGPGAIPYSNNTLELRDDDWADWT
jgi:N-acetylglucosamine-6-sulfatase